MNELLKKINKEMKIRKSELKEYFLFRRFHIKILKLSQQINNILAS